MNPMKNKDKTKKPANDKSDKTKKSSKVSSKVKQLIKDNDTITTLTEQKQRLDTQMTFSNNTNTNNLNHRYLEEKFNENLYVLDSQLENTASLLKAQDNINKKLNNLNKDITISDIKLEKLIVKSETDDYYNLLSKYSQSLDSLHLKFKSQLKDLEKLKELKEENKGLKTKIELMEIKYKEEKAISDAKLQNFKNFLCIELNNFTEYLNELGGVFVNRFSQYNIEENSLTLFFQNLKALTRDLFKKDKTYDNIKSIEQKKLNQLQEENNLLLQELNELKTFNNKYSREREKDNAYSVYQDNRNDERGEIPYLNYKYNYNYASQCQNQNQTQTMRNESNNQYNTDVYSFNKELSKFKNEDNKGEYENAFNTSNKYSRYTNDQFYNKENDQLRYSDYH